MSVKSYRLENNLIDVYFQKSSKFLYPLVAPVAPVYPVQPEQVFTAWNNYYVSNRQKVDLCI